MATRAIIKVEGSKACVYKHWDGNPSSTLPWLCHFYTAFFQERGGHNADYCLAQLLRSSILLCEQFNLDPSRATGWGVEILVKGKIDIGQEYEYTLLESGKVQVYVPGGNSVTVDPTDNARIKDVCETL